MKGGNKMEIVTTQTKEKVQIQQSKGKCRQEGTMKETKIGHQT